MNRPILQSSYGVTLVGGGPVTGRDLKTALTVGIVEPLVQMVFFTLHDRIWASREARRAAQPA